MSTIEEVPSRKPEDAVGVLLSDVLIAGRHSIAEDEVRVDPVTATSSASGTTYLPREELPVDDPEPQRIAGGIPLESVLTVAGAAAAALSIGLLFSGVLGVITLGWMPFVSFLWFIAIYCVLVFLRESGPAVRNSFWTVIITAAAVVVIGTLALVVGFVLIRGSNVFTQIFAASDQPLLQRLHFFTTDMSGVGPLSGLEVGGIFYALVGTIEQIGIALIITVPLGLTCAVFLSEVGGRFARFVRTIVEAMTALPSVVAGLFIYAAIILAITHENSGFAAALALTILMLPIMIRSSDVVLRLVPGNLREAGLALGAGQWATVWYVVLPTVRSGLTTAIILATAHGIGETAPVLLTSGVTSNTNFDPFHNPMTSLPLAALEFIESPRASLIARGFATAAFLLFLVIVLFAIARAIGGQDAGVTSERHERRMARRSISSLDRVRRSQVAIAEHYSPSPPPVSADSEDLP